MPAWAAGLITAAVLFVAAGITGMVGKKEVTQVPPAAQEVVTSVKTDIEHVKGARHDRT